MVIKGGAGVITPTDRLGLMWFQFPQVPPRLSYLLAQLCGRGDRRVEGQGGGGGD